MVEAKWSGKYPTLCFGEWTLNVDGKDVSLAIPEYMRKESMNTYGFHHSWHFDDNWQEVIEDYEDGLEEEEWIEENNYWLCVITNNMELKQEIFRTIQEADFRRGECGGCV